ncbi:hypothetical protein Trydic_g6388 [Trypoxylus dichotomus]
MADLLEHPDWRTSFADGISSLLPKIERYNKDIREFAADPKNAQDMQEFLEEHRTRFIEEYNRRPPVQIENLRDNQVRKLQRKRQNITEAIEYLFGESIITNELRVSFDLELAITLHQKIGEGLIDSLGIFRQNIARPNGFDFDYLDPAEIESNLRELFTKINEPVEPGKSDWYNVATEFFNKFLFSHPFSNGNGRVAIFLVSALLINYTIIPVCFYAWKSNSNDLYLRVLQEAHQFKNDQLLKSYIIEAVHGTLEYCVHFLGIYDN